MATIPSIWQPLGPVTEAVLFHGLPGAPPAPRDAEAWIAGSPELLRHRLAPLALAAAAAAGIDLPSDLRSAFRAWHVARMASVMAMEVEAPRVADLLASRGIRTVFTKGIGLAREYPDPSWRTFVDMDVLVPTARYRDALDALAADGYASSDEVPPRRYFYTRCREATALQRGRLSIDLHHRLPPWAFGARLTFDRLAADARTLELETGSIRVPSTEHQAVVALLHLFSHLGKPGEEPMVWRDVVTLAHAADPSALTDTLERARLTGLARYAFDCLPGQVRPPVADRLDPQIPWRLSARARRLVPPHLGARHLIGMLYRIPVSSVVPFVAGYAFPSREFLARHGSDDGRLSLLGWWRAAAAGVGAARERFASQR